MFGYNGKIAYINLDDHKINTKKLTPEIAEEYIGGVGLSAKLTYDILQEKDYETLKQNPFSGKNPLIFATGPLTASITPSSSRYSVTGISPLTGIWGESTSGGYFPLSLRKSGYDALVLTGKSSQPIYILIREAEIEIKSAQDVWGMNTREIPEKIRTDLDDNRIRVACIGKAGENLVNYACIINDEGRAAGRCGLGALMGSKNLKALAVKGSNKIELANKDGMVKVSKRALNNVKNAFTTNFMSNHGTLLYTDMGMILGDIPAYYFTETEFNAEKITGQALKEKYPVIQYRCAGCTIGCGRTTIAEIDGQEEEIDGPEYETLAAFGPMCGIFDFDPVLKSNHLCNLEGSDTISAGVSISFLIYLVENKIAHESIKSYLTDINIESIKWGNKDVIVSLLKQIINKEGIGVLLSKGVRSMAHELEVNPELAAHVKGLEIPMHDPRAYHGQALSYMTCCIGASHEKGDFFNIDGDAASFRKIDQGNRFKIDGREESVLRLQDLANIYDSAVICNFTHLNVPTLGRLFLGSTGFSSLKNKKKIYLAGERATNLKRLISCKLGLSREDDSLPRIVTKMLESGGSARIKLDLDDNLTKFYELRGWDYETGFPNNEKLRELNLL
jgi:aldehyde:ferredoxin oxidoreductase